MIEGKMINLRAREMGDLDRNYRWINDREVTRLLGMRYPISLAAGGAWMRGAPQSPWRSLPACSSPIETKDGEHIGNISFTRCRRSSGRRGLGVTIGEQSHWSKGYGTDAMLTFLRFAFEEMNLHRVDLTVDADNHARSPAIGSAGSWRRGGCARRTTPRACTAMWW